jgi:Nucleotidyltransferase domain
MSINHNRPLAPEDCVRAVWADRFPTARVIFYAGSVLRGEHTPWSDLDLVVVYDSLPNAYRESFCVSGWPIEAFVHDPETLRYFFGTDRTGGVPVLATMVAEGAELPAPNEFSQELKQLAREFLAAGPPVWTEAERSLSRYCITDLIDDVRAPRSPAEVHASIARLYEMLATHYFRARGLWSARGKAIPRKLQQIDEPFANAFVDAFRRAFAQAETTPLMGLCEAILARDGGLLFDGYRADAPADWRVVASN